MIKREKAREREKERERWRGGRKQQQVWMPHGTKKMKQPLNFPVLAFEELAS